MDDLIKRSDAIKHLKRWFHSKGWMVSDEDCKSILWDIPSADRWIPCSEKLPTTAGHYLCSFEKPNYVDNIYVGLAYWTGGRWYGYLASAINAWMPLPKPWKGADDES